MNVCLIIGKIISDIDFKFIVSNKRNAVIIFNIQINDDTILKVKGYNEITDFCLSQLKQNDKVGIYGILNTNGEIEIQEIELFTFR